MDLWYSEFHSETIKFSVQVEKQLLSKQSPFQRIDVFESKELGRFFTLDGYIMITEKDEFIYHDMIVHVPMHVNPNIKKVLVIGAGDGGTVRELCRYPSIERIDMVEIDEMVVQVCEEYFPISAHKLRDERVSLYFEDGLKFVSQKKNEYDLIIVDSTDPFGPGEGLFTRSFYQDCFSALNENGILVNQHESPFYDHYKKNMQRAHKRIIESFPIAQVYQAFIPTYASGHWLIGFASKKFDPVLDFKKDDWKSLNLIT
ncbi:MAG: polyamine aminopropyltransferase, partial [Erysipelotrichaceae bacterium]|nr:polyamine aminopropyltransferase [Erysipelotrichaceae bacterium]